MITICYVTCRKQPHFEWFFDSLQAQATWEDLLQVVVVDLHAADYGRHEEVTKAAKGRPVTHLAPKRNRWQGPGRETVRDFFAAANARNSVFGFHSEFIAWVDDLSVLSPTWLASVVAAQRGNYVVYGMFKKVTELVVREGLIESSKPHPRWDNREKEVREDLTPWKASRLYGCSLAGPAETFLKVGGWPEFCDGGVASEDSCFGKLLENAGVRAFLDRRMLTYEAEDLHLEEERLGMVIERGSPLRKCFFNGLVEMAYYPSVK